MKKLDIHLKNLEKEQQNKHKECRRKENMIKFIQDYRLAEQMWLKVISRRELRKLVKVWAAKGVKWKW